jgi:hypothetical protein
MRCALLVLVGCGTSAIATGDVGTWTNGPALPTPRANHCSTAVGDWIVVIGGNHSDAGAFVKTDEIHAAKLVDGVLGDWVLAGHTASPVTECEATSDGTTLYVVGGIYDTDGDGGKVYSGTFTEGAVTLSVMGILPDGAFAISSEAAVRDGALLVMNTDVPANGDAGSTTTLSTPLPQMTWSTSDWGIGFHSQSQFAFGRDAAYTLGGYQDVSIGAVADTFVEVAGKVTPTTPLPMPIGWGEATVVDDWMFVTGGRASTFAADGTTTVLSAPIASDGTLGDWVWQPPLPVARTNHDMALVGDYLVITGGATSGPGDDQVLLARVRQ